MIKIALAILLAIFMFYAGYMVGTMQRKIDDFENFLNKEESIDDK